TGGKPEGPITNLYSTEPYKWPDFTIDNKAYQQALADIGKGKTFAELSADERHKVYAEAQHLKEQMLGKKTDNLYSPEAPAPVFYSKAQIVAFDKVTNNASGSSVMATLKNNG